ncbi:MAG: hypothetical protein E3J72_11210 [Planctomycetota bacterium]|nr:MAG: hypothetical protein E3J72_11210 [Planctomycetota bacterium]
MPPKEKLERIAAEFGEIRKSRNYDGIGVKIPLYDSDADDRTCTLIVQLSNLFTELGDAGKGYLEYLKLIMSEHLRVDIKDLPFKLFSEGDDDYYEEVHWGFHDFLDAVKILLDAALEDLDKHKGDIYVKPEDITWPPRFVAKILGIALKTLQNKVSENNYSWVKRISGKHWMCDVEEFKKWWASLSKQSEGEKPGSEEPRKPGRPRKNIIWRDSMS